MVEEVSIWGWPLQTAGVLAAECSTRSFTVIKGRVREVIQSTIAHLAYLHILGGLHRLISCLIDHFVSGRMRMPSIWLGKLVIVHGHKKNGVPLWCSLIQIHGSLSTEEAFSCKIRSWFQLQWSS